VTVAPPARRINRGRGHSYEIDGNPVLGITTILRNGIPKPAFVDAAAKTVARYAVDHWAELNHELPTRRLDQIIASRYEQLQKASARGTQVHQYAHQLQAGQELEIPDELDGYVRAYLAFTEDWQPDEILVEQPVYSRDPPPGYAGTPDLVAKLADGRLWLLDWKTSDSGIWPEMVLQLAAARYAQFIVDENGLEQPNPAQNVDACGCVSLKSDGSYELIPADADAQAFRVFLHAQRVAQFVQQAKDDRWHLLGGALEPPGRNHP
jgi:hypothetical protein